MIELRNICKDYGKGEATVHALKNVSLTIRKGELVAIIGTSGSGKSTLMNMLGCIDSPTCGEYFLEGRNIHSCKAKELAAIRNKKFGFVMQDFALVDDYSVMQNVEIPLVYAKVPKNQRQKLIGERLGQLGISDKKHTGVTKLSGGQRQRVAIARALINDPDIILADEPTGALDSANGRLVVDILKKVNEQGKTVVIITHDLSIARQCKCMIRIEDGCVIDEGCTRDEECVSDDGCVSEDKKRERQGA